MFVSFCPRCGNPHRSEAPRRGNRRQTYLTHVKLQHADLTERPQSLLADEMLATERFVP